MTKLRWFLLGALTLGVAAVPAGWTLLEGTHGFSAREQPSRIERWLARGARSAAVPKQAKALANPLANTSEVLAEARAHWADHCAVCHANDGGGDTPMGQHMYPPAPDMRLAETQQLSDGELFYIVQNGIRLTGMPAWGGGSDHDANDSWKLVHFIRHLPELSFEEKKEMEKLNPKGPEDRKEEEEEQRFLRGDDTNEPPTEHHHHH